MTESVPPPPPPPDNTPPVPPSPAPTAAPVGSPLDYGTAAGSTLTPGIYPGPYAGPAPDKDARMMGMLAHLLALAGFVIPFGNIVGPLVIWLVKREQSPFVDDQGKESLNFQIWVTILSLLCVPLVFCFGLGLIPLAAILIGSIVLEIMAGVKANEGVAYRYPFTPFRLIK